MPDSPPINPSPTAIADRGKMRRALLSDLGGRIAAPGGAAEYVHDAPGSDLEQLHGRVTPVLKQASALSEDERESAQRIVDAGTDRALGRPPRQSTSEIPVSAPEPQLGMGAAPTTSARDAYLDARVRAGVIGVALADPRMRRALVLDSLARERDRTACSLPDGFDASRKPPLWRVRERRLHQATARALDANGEWQEQLRGELGPDSEQLVRRALKLAEAREDILARTPDLQRDAIAEELSREPEWLTQTLGPRPEQGAGRWQVLAGQLAANRLRFLIADDADPGIRPDQPHLTQQVAQFQAEARLTQSMVLTPDVGLGM